MKYEEWREGKWIDYKSTHPLFEELHDIVSEIMYLDGPDRHTDGSNLIAGYILDRYDVRPLESTAKTGAAE